MISRLSGIALGPVMALFTIAALGDPVHRLLLRILGAIFFAVSVTMFLLPGYVDNPTTEGFSPRFLYALLALMSSSAMLLCSMIGVDDLEDAP